MTERSTKPKLQRRRYVLRLALVLMVLGLLGLVLRWTIRDRVPLIATLFYGLPPLVAAVYLALASLLFACLRRRRLILVTSIMTVIAVVAWIQSDHVRAIATEPAGHRFRVILWNISGPDEIAEGVLTALTQADGQIVVLAESGGPNPKRDRLLELRFPGYHLLALGGGVRLLSQYPVVGATMEKMGTRTYFGLYDLDTPFGMISVVVPDLISNPFVWRKPYVDRAYEVATARPYPTIVLGDFNTPHTSVFFRDFRRTFQHAFEQSGHGFETTWLGMLPVLALDHVWLSKEFVPLNTELKRTFYSDHAMVIADVQLKDAPDRPQESERGQNG